MELLTTTLESIKEELMHALKQVQSAEELEQVRILFIGRQGKIASLMEMLKSLSIDQKKIFGPQCNALKNFAEQAYAEKHLFYTEQSAQLAQERKKQFDVTAYLPHTLRPSLHIYTRVIQDIEDIFISMGYAIADGPEVETDFYNFEALNIPADHPARDMHDTFWINDNHLLRTHTSTVQIRKMNNEQPPFALASVGRVFRSEATDASHEFMFTQYEGLFVGKNISLAQLVGTLKTFLKRMFNKEDLDIRVRPGYFPFVEPGLEIDASCPFCNDGCATCKYTCWIELLGAGLVHPNVLKYCNIDSEVYTGFAFGGGVERLAGIKYGIHDIRLFHSSKTAFLDQF